MAIKLIKLVDLEYHEAITLGVIEADAQLNTIFKSDLKLSFPILITLSKEDRLGTETKHLLRSVFDDVILKQSDLLDKYKLIAHKNGITLSVVTPVTPTDNEEVVKETAEIVAEIVAEIPKPSKATTPKPKKTTDLPRRYGKENILKDVERQSGKATPLQNAMLRVNDLKNIYVNLNARGIKDMVGGSNLLSDADCREITSAIQIIERKLETILKRKK